MHIKYKLLSTAAVIAMAAGAIYGGIVGFKAVNIDSTVLSWFGTQKETIYFYYTDESLTNYINSAAVSFGEEKNARVFPVLIESGEYLEALNKASIAGEQTPDAFIITNDNLEKAYLGGLATEVRDYGYLTTNNFCQEALDAVTYDGMYVAYPFYYDTSVLLYNVDYLSTWADQQAAKQEENATAEGSSEEEGLDSEETEGIVVLENGVPQTLDDILSVANSFDAPETLDVVLNWDVSDVFYDYWVIGNYVNVGGAAGDDSSMVDLNNESVVAAMTAFQSLNQFFSIESDTVDYNEVLQDFIEGRVMFTIVNGDAIDVLAKAVESGEMQFEYAFLNMPSISEELDSKSLSVTEAIAVSQYSEHKEIANEFATYLVAKQYDTLYAKTGQLSCNKKATAADSAYAGSPDAIARAVFAKEYENSVSLPKLMTTGNYWLYMESVFDKIWNGEDVALTMNGIDETIENQVG